VCLLAFGPLSIEALTTGAELVVQGKLTRPTSYLTADENYVLTDCPYPGAHNRRACSCEPGYTWSGYTFDPHCPWRRILGRRCARSRSGFHAGVSGAKESRPALDDVIRAARRRQVDTLVCWRLDRLGRNLRHLILLLDELTAVGVGFVSLNEGIDTTTPARRLQLNVLGAIAEFERERVRERVRAGLARARRQGQRLGRPRVTRLSADAPLGLTVRDAATLWGVSKSTAARRLAGGLAPGGTNLP
jgi:putative DNA-invertase from lambdoid prophage Rac